MDKLQCLHRPKRGTGHNSYGKFSVGHLRKIRNQLNARLIKWVKWEPGL